MIVFAQVPEAVTDAGVIATVLISILTLAALLNRILRHAAARFAEHVEDLLAEHTRREELIVGDVAASLDRIVPKLEDAAELTRSNGEKIDQLTVRIEAVEAQLGLST